MRKTNLRRHMLKAHPGVSKAEEDKGWSLRRYLLPLLVVAVAAALGLAAAYFLEVKRIPIAAVVNTDLGTFEVELNTKSAPITAANFIKLAEKGFYDGLTFHRVAENFVIQGGDPAGTGAGGSDENVPWEDTGLKNVKYSIAMARAGDPNSAETADSATSQFFINLKNNTALDEYAYPFVVFGIVTGGFEVVDAIGALYPPEGDGPPTQRVEMNVSIRYKRSIAVRG